MSWYARMRLIGWQRYSLFSIVCLAFASLACCGCALPHHASERLAAEELSSENEEQATTETAETVPDEKPPAKAEAATVEAEKHIETAALPAKPAAEPQVDPAALAAVMGQMQDLRALDPAAHDQLMRDLKHVDPKLWPMLVQGFKASVEYRQRKHSPAVQTAASIPSTSPTPLPPQPAAPVVQATTVGPTGALPAAPHAIENHPVAAAPVQGVSHEAPRPPADWRQPLDATIRSLEAALAESPSPADDDRQVSLRMLYLLSGQRDKALRPLAGHDAMAQEFWSRELYALSTYLDSKHLSDRSRRASEAAIHHWEASQRLSQLGNLVVRNLAFCREVLSYGVYTPFERLELQPGQRVVLYAEVENFVSEPTPRGHHTALRTSYQIFDSRGQKVDDHEFPVMEEHCQNPRRDFFIAYEAIRLPTQIYEGKYTLKLTIEDTLGKKVGQSSLDFQVKKEAGKGAAR